MTADDNLVSEAPDVYLFRLFRGYYESKVMLALWRTGLLKRMCAGESLKLARLAGDYDIELLGALLDYVTVRGIVQRDDDLYTLTQRGTSLIPYYGYLATVIGAYEPVMGEVENLITGRKRYGSEVHRSNTDMAVGLISLEDNLMDQFPTLLEGRPFTKAMDLGCGSARMLSRIVQSRPGVTGVGVDTSEELCAIARRTVADEQLDDRVTIVAGDAGEVSRLPSSARDGVDLVTIMFVLHELLWQRGRAGVLTCLRDIAGVLDNHGTLLAVEVESIGEPQANDDLLFVPEYELTHVLTHQRLTTKHEWRQLAEEAGLHLERIEPLPMCRSFCMVLTPQPSNGETG